MSTTTTLEARPSPPTTVLRFLSSERDLLERYLPGLDAQLAAIPLDVMEARGNPAIRLFKEARGPALLIPAKYGGLGAGPVEGLRVLRSIASRAPSLGIACTMHGFSVSTLVEWAVFGEEYGAALLSGLAENSMYLASGFAEGRSGARPLDMTMRARKAPGGGWLLSGRKKPCTLTYSMDFLTCGVAVDGGDGLPRRGVGLVPADSPGIERRPFWKSHVLAGAESDEVVLDDVHVPDQFVFVADDSSLLDPVELAGYVSFQLSLASTYLGVVSGLVERLLKSGKGTPEERGWVLAQVEAQAAAIDGAAFALAARDDGERLLARALAVRFAAQSAVEAVAMRCAELLGGMAFIGSS
ncbi:MAG TPA: acyl-CoA dehydrogenase family protein, partial [Planctomycetaceae bacterium]